MVHVAAAVTYTPAVMFAALPAKGTVTDREDLVRVLLAAGIMLVLRLDACNVALPMAAAAQRKAGHLDFGSGFSAECVSGVSELADRMRFRR